MIAKSYYGREAHQGVQRLSEGKFALNFTIIYAIFGTFFSKLKLEKLQKGSKNSVNKIVAN
jgi:hypothetical protein